MRDLKRGAWGTRLGFYLAAIGSAFGLGNLWRFPYVVAANGGGAFVLLYIVLAFVVGFPLMVGELILGKTTRKSAIAALSDSSTNAPSPRHRIWRWVGLYTVFVTIIVLSYYAVISGWVLHFVMRTLVESFHPSHYDPAGILAELRNNGWLQIGLTSVHLLFCILVVSRGLDEGVEKWVGYMAPAFIALLVALVAESLSLPTATSALRFLFYPDFSRLTWSSMNQAVGHVFFTLSIGFGSMVTFGSYLSEKQKVPEAALRVTALDTLISLTAGLLIFPIALSSIHQARGPEVLFLTLPLLFQKMTWGPLYAVAFFLCLYFAALNASIGLLESIVSNMMDRLHLSRETASWTAGFVCFLVAVFPALGSSVLKTVSIHGQSVLAFVDDILINWMLPLAALGLALYVCHVLPNSKKEREFRGDPAVEKVFGNWVFVMKWLAPGIILIAIALQIIGLVV